MCVEGVFGCFFGIWGFSVSVERLCVELSIHKFCLGEDRYGIMGWWNNGNCVGEKFSTCPLVGDYQCACGMDVPRSCLCRRTFSLLSSSRLCGYALRHAHSTFHPASRCYAGLVDLLLLTAGSSVSMTGLCACPFYVTFICNAGWRGSRPRQGFS